MTTETVQANQGAKTSLADQDLVMCVGTNGTYGPITVANLAKIIRESMQIGGRNLLTGSRSGAGWNPTPVDGVYERSTSGSAEVTIMGPAIPELETGKTYTVSFYAKATSNMKDMDVWLSAIEGGVSKTNLKVTTEWKRYELTYTIAVGKKLGARFRIDNNGSSDGKTATLWVKDIKVEEGNVSSAWSPAIDDIASGNWGGGNYISFNQLHFKRIKFAERRVA